MKLSQSHNPSHEFCELTWLTQVFVFFFNWFFFNFIFYHLGWLGIKFHNFILFIFAFYGVILVSWHELRVWRVKPSLLKFFFFVFFFNFIFQCWIDRELNLFWFIFYWFISVLWSKFDKLTFSLLSWLGFFVFQYLVEWKLSSNKKYLYAFYKIIIVS